MPPVPTVNVFVETEPGPMETGLALVSGRKVRPRIEIFEPRVVAKLAAPAPELLKKTLVVAPGVPPASLPMPPEALATQLVGFGLPEWKEVHEASLAPVPIGSDGSCALGDRELLGRRRAGESKRIAADLGCCQAAGEGQAARVHNGIVRGDDRIRAGGERGA